MLQKIISIIFILNTLHSVCETCPQIQLNNTNALDLINLKLSEISVKQDHHLQMTDEIIKTMCRKDREEKVTNGLGNSDFESFKADLRILRSEVERLKEELDHQKKKELEQETALLTLKNYLLTLKRDLDEQQMDNNENELQIQSLSANLKTQKEADLENKSAIKSLKEEQERHSISLDKLTLESEKRNSWFDPHYCIDAKISGVYNTLLSSYSNQPFKVACDANTLNGGWTIILRRIDGSVDFNRNWTEYKNGFGDLNGEFIMGLDKIHALTTDSEQELLVVLEDYEGEVRFELYDKFAIGNEYQQYKLHTLGKASGNAGDSLYNHRGMKFSTFDRDNDLTQLFCAKMYNSGWWYKSCHESQLTGVYGDKRLKHGVIWHHFRGFGYSLKRAVMMIRPKN